MFPLTAYQVKTEDFEQKYRHKKVDTKAENQSLLSQTTENGLDASTINIPNFL